jgi:hypothetical protein
MRRMSAQAIDVMSLPGCNLSSRFPQAGCDDAKLAGGMYHDFVIEAFGRNKLKS